MPKPIKLTPALFDLPQDIVRDLPFDIVEKWVKSGQTSKDAIEILESTKIKGTSVSTDSAGLTRLSQSKGLIEILALINRPKEIVHGYGKSIGGTAVGIWAADNTQMFYPDNILSDDITTMLLGVQTQIEKESDIRIGIGAHFGEFYSIGGGLYGVEAEEIESIAEDKTEGGEIVVSQSFCNRLSKNHNFNLQKRTDLTKNKFSAFSVIDGPKLHPNGEHDEKYPIPFSTDFYHDLKKVDNFTDISKKYSKELVVVLVERSKQIDTSNYASLLNDLASSILMRKLSLPLLKNGIEIKIAGNLGIFVFEKIDAALEFAMEFRKVLRLQNINSRIGIDKGEVLLFDLQGGGHDIAGNPVNIASKMAQDKGKLGKIYITADSVENAASSLSGFSKITFAASGVEIDAFEG